MRKKSDAEGFFDDGLTYLFKDNQGELIDLRPKHIHFECLTKTAEEMETCDFRFYSVEKVEPVTFESKPEADEARRLDGHEGEEEPVEATTEEAEEE